MYILNSKTKGRGVFTAKRIKKGDVIEVCHIIEIPKLELPIIHKTVLHDYYFIWGEEMDRCAIALGYGSLYNHALNGNAEFILDIGQSTIDFVAIEDIPEGGEILVNYHGENGDASPIWWDQNN